LQPFKVIICPDASRNLLLEAPTAEAHRIATIQLLDTVDMLQRMGIAGCAVWNAASQTGNVRAGPYLLTVALEGPHLVVVWLARPSVRRDPSESEEPGPAGASQLADERPQRHARVRQPRRRGDTPDSRRCGRIFLSPSTLLAGRHALARPLRATEVPTLDQVWRARKQR
jgi:hypothetical protein